jgi:hypothetical protein
VPPGAAPPPESLTYTTPVPVTSGVAVLFTSLARCQRTRPVTGSIRYSSSGSVLETATPPVLADTAPTGPAVAARHSVRPVAGDSAVTGHTAGRGEMFCVFVYTIRRPATT